LNPKKSETQRDNIKNGIINFIEAVNEEVKQKEHIDLLKRENWILFELFDTESELFYLKYFNSPFLHPSYDLILAADIRNRIAQQISKEALSQLLGSGAPLEEEEKICKAFRVHQDLQKFKRYESPIKGDDLAKELSLLLQSPKTSNQIIVLILELLEEQKIFKESELLELLEKVVQRKPPSGDVLHNVSWLLDKSSLYSFDAQQKQIIYAPMCTRFLNCTTFEGRIGSLGEMITSCGQPLTLLTQLLEKSLVKPIRVGAAKTLKEICAWNLLEAEISETSKNSLPQELQVCI
jgi:hypothetical protein